LIELYYGRLTGRYFPFIGEGIMAIDVAKNIAIPMSDANAAYMESNRIQGNWISNLPH
jgi:hypothetical protein